MPPRSMQVRPGVGTSALREIGAHGSFKK